MSRHHVPLWLGLAVLASCATARPDPAVLHLAGLEERRAGVEELLAATKDLAHPAVRARALLALGRGQWRQSLAAVQAALGDPDRDVRAAAAFSAGLLTQAWNPFPPGQVEPFLRALEDRWPVEPDAAVLASLLIAEGRSAAPSAVDALVQRLNQPRFQVPASLALGLAAKKGARLPAPAFKAFGPFVQPGSPQELRYAATFALALSKSDQARASLLTAVGDSDWTIRALAAKGLGDVGVAADVPVLAGHLTDPDLQVAVETTRALTKMAGACAPGAACPALDALAGLTGQLDALVASGETARLQPFFALAQVNPGPRFASLLEKWRVKLVAPVRAGTPPAVIDALNKTDCRLAAVQMGHAQAWSPVRACGRDAVPEGLRMTWGLRALPPPPAGGADARAALVEPYLRHAASSVRLAALEAISGAVGERARAAVRPLLDDSDRVVAGAAALAASALKDRGAIPLIARLVPEALNNADLAPPIAEAILNLDARELAPNVQVWLEARSPLVRQLGSETLFKLTGTRVSVPDIVASPTERDDAGDAAVGRRLRFETTRGTFVVALDRERAPVTTRHIWELARRKFYDGLLFHRVVPGFVAQGGDPRGDGEGGPGFSIRCELNDHPYRRGTVGMALSGHDTGGSQFFVALTPQPHLDGRYTVFGEVASGMEVVDALLEGDRIERVRAE